MQDLFPYSAQQNLSCPSSVHCPAIHSLRLIFFVVLALSALCIPQLAQANTVLGQTPSDAHWFASVACYTAKSRADEEAKKFCSDQNQRIVTREYSPCWIDEASEVFPLRQNGTMTFENRIIEVVRVRLNFGCME